MIRYINNDEIDTKKWDRCIQKSVNGNPYALSWYLDIIHGEWEALVDGNYERVMPLTGNKKYGIDYLFQPYFAQQLGVFSTDKLNPEIVKEFLQAIPSRYRYIDINLNSYNKIEGNEYEIIYNSNYLLDLIPDYEHISESYSKNTKRNLKKSLLHDLVVMKGLKPEELIRLFRENRGKTVKNWGDEQYHRLGRLMYMAIHKGKGMIYGVYDEHNQLCAGAFFLKSNNRLVFLFSGTNDTGKQVAAMTYLIDHVIEEYTPGQLVLDFEGSNNPGLARFYKGFGAKEIHYPRIKINRLPFPVRQIFFLYEMLKKK